MTRIPSLGPRGEGWVALQMVMIFGFAFAGSLGPALPVTDPAVGGALRGIGYGLIAAGLVLLVSGLSLLGRAHSLTAVPRPLETSELTTSGPYAFIRHPAYAALVLAGLGATLLWWTWLSLAATIGLFVVLDLKRRREEVWLLDRFEGYAAYRARTKAWVPFVY